MVGLNMPNSADCQSEGEHVHLEDLWFVKGGLTRPGVQGMAGGDELPPTSECATV